MKCKSKLVYYYVKLTGLAPFTMMEDRFYPPTILGRLYSVSFATVHSVVATIGVASSLSIIKSYGFSQFQEISITIHVLTSLPTTYLTIMIFQLMYKKILHVMNKLRDIGNELKRLGIEEDHEKFFNKLFMKIVMTNITVIGISVMLSCIEPNWPITYSIKFVIDAWLYLNVTLIFTHMLFFIKQRFKLVNKKLYNVFRQADHRRSLNNLDMFAICESLRGETQPSIEILTDLQQIRKIEALHLELGDLVERITDLFAVPIIFKTIELCTGLLLHSFWLYFSTQKSEQHISTAEIISFVLNILCSLMRIVFTIVNLFVVAYASVKTCKEGNDTIIVLFRVWYKLVPRDIDNEFYMFSLQLMQKPVIVSIFGFFNLDYSYVYQIFCVVITYLIILIQFDNPRMISST